MAAKLPLGKRPVLGVTLKISLAKKVRFKKTAPSILKNAL
jgi:hypothetical protein